LVSYGEFWFLSDNLSWSAEGREQTGYENVRIQNDFHLTSFASDGGDFRVDLPERHTIGAGFNGSHLHGVDG
jgi:hypothetical protein